MKHKFHKCDPCENPGRCQFCDGGLSFCTVCKCGEGDLPTECPGEPVDAERQLEIYNGASDFVGGQWIGYAEGDEL